MTIADRLRQTGHDKKADKLDTLAEGWHMGTVSMGEYAREFWLGVRVLQRDGGL